MEVTGIALRSQRVVLREKRDDLTGGFGAFSVEKEGF